MFVEPEWDYTRKPLLMLGVKSDFSLIGLTKEEILVTVNDEKLRLQNQIKNIHRALKQLSISNMPIFLPNTNNIKISS